MGCTGVSRMSPNDSAGETLSKIDSKGRFLHHTGQVLYHGDTTTQDRCSIMETRPHRTGALSWRQDFLYDIISRYYLDMRRRLHVIKNGGNPDDDVVTNPPSI